MATLEEVYCKFGEVSEAAQLLETELGNILIMLGIVQGNLFDKSSPEEAAALFKSVNSHTLGQLLSRLHRSTDSVGHIDSLLSTALAERNRLSHSFYRQHNFRRNTDAGCALMLSDLNAMHVTILAAYKAVLLLSGVDLDHAEIESLPTVHRPI